MTENLGRKTTLIVLLTLAAIACIVTPFLLGSKPFRLGLDLQGGTRLVYKFDFEQAVKDGILQPGELNRKQELLQEFATIIRGRVDPKGVMELSLRPEGENRLVIELPGAAEIASVKTVGRLANPLGGDATTDEGSKIVLEAASDAQKTTIKSFPLGGAMVRIGSEKIAYKSRNGATLIVAKRGADSTSISTHAAGDEIELLTTDWIQQQIENVGDMSFYLSAEANDFAALGTDSAKEQNKLDTWRAANPTAPIDEFKRLAPEAGGPTKGILWFPMRLKSDELETAESQRRMVPLVLPRPKDPSLPAEAWVFTGSDLGQVGFTSDEKGYPAVAFQMSTERQSAFADFTGANIQRGMAIVMNGEIVTLATIQNRLSGQSLINGGAAGFTQKEVSDLITVLRSGSLRIKPQLLDKSRVGASLGDEYVARAFYSSMAALALIVVFMLFFYRRLGVFSVIGLTINVLLLLGSLALLRATLTLPGVAGIILTLGMAVDGNILIYERLREEMNRGLKLVQAVKASFERAAVTIIDANLTTLIAGAILYFMGTGPIRGFATTLNIGILTTLFTVIVVTEVLVLRDVKAGAKPYSMIKVLEKPSIRFMDAARYLIPISMTVMVAGIALFAWMPNEKKLGIDFLGGFTATVRTQEPQTKEKIEELVGTIQGTTGQSAQVVAITDSGAPSGGFRMFRITSKLRAEETVSDETNPGETALKEIRDALTPVLQRGPVELTLTGNAVQGEIYFEDDHSIEDVSKVLGTLGVDKATAAPMGTQPHAFTFSGEAKPDTTSTGLDGAIETGITGVKDSRGVAYRLAGPIPESAFVGAQVGGELRDKAVLAVLLSLLGTVLYLRFRFAEYSYGIAVVVSLAHDVLIALGALALAAYTGLLQAELDLSMIAAFLTIIGYSQNDTIVIFDRVRENIPKSKKPLRDVLDDSINETLGRTILTTSTVVLTLLVLFLFNVGSRNVLEGFSFCMLVGVISGAYSTVYVASPILLWFENRAKAREARESGGTPPSAA